MNDKSGSSKNKWRLRSGITTDDIDSFAQRYRNSSAEKKAIKDAYVKGCGSMEYILETVMCTTVADEPRIRCIIQEMIESKTVPVFQRFVRDDPDARENRKRRANEEAVEAKRMCQDMAGMARRRQQNFNQFLEYLEAKYKDDSGDDCHSEQESSEDESSDSDSEMEIAGRRKHC